MKVLSCWMPGCFYRLYFVAAAVTTTYWVEETDRILCFSSWLDVFYARCNWTCQTRGIGEQNLYNARCLNASLHGKRHKTRSIWNTKNAWNLAVISFSTTTPIRLMPLLLAGIINCIHYQVWDDITLPIPNINRAQIATMQPVKFGNGLVISLCTLLGM